MSDYKIHYYVLNRILSSDWLNTDLTLNLYYNMISVRSVANNVMQFEHHVNM